MTPPPQRGPVRVHRACGCDCAGGSRSAEGEVRDDAGPSAATGAQEEGDRSRQDGAPVSVRDTGRCAGLAGGAGSPSRGSRRPRSWHRRGRSAALSPRGPGVCRTARTGHLGRVSPRVCARISPQPQRRPSPRALGASLVGRPPTRLGSGSGVPPACAIDPPGSEGSEGLLLGPRVCTTQELPRSLYIAQ